jgi:hypothetical protein
MKMLGRLLCLLGRHKWSGEGLHLARLTGDYDPSDRFTSSRYCKRCQRQMLIRRIGGEIVEVWEGHQK